MYKVGIYLRVRKACFVEGMSVREAARVFGLHRDTVRKMLEYSVPPGYRRQRPARRPKLDPYKGVMDQILEQDLTSPKKQRHTAKRIYQRLRDEHGFPGKCTIDKDYVRERRRHTREMFLPLSHPPGHAQCDYGEARVIIGGVERKAHYFALDLPHSDGCYVKAYPAETTESFCDGHVSAFAFLSGVPQSILYDNTTLAVARILGDGRRQRTRVFSELQSHYLFEDRFGQKSCPDHRLLLPLIAHSAAVTSYLRWIRAKGPDRQDMVNLFLQNETYFTMVQCLFLTREEQGQITGALDSGEQLQLGDRISVRGQVTLKNGVPVVIVGPNSVYRLGPREDR